MAVAVAGNCSSNLTPSLETPYAAGMVLKKKKVEADLAFLISTEIRCVCVFQIRFLKLKNKAKV